MKISVIHPSRNRPQQAVLTAIKWMGMADNPDNIEYIMMCDFSDSEIAEYSKQFNGRYKKSPSIYCEDNHSAIEAINNAARLATGDLLVVISDDFDTFFGWDTLLLKELKGKSDFLLKTQDGIQKTLVTLPIMDRSYYNRFGYIYHPDYQHMGCDVELTAVAMMTGRLIPSQLQFPHNHYSTGKTVKDTINEKNDLTYAHGDMILTEHLKNNFGIKNPLIQYNQIQWH